MPTFKFYQDVKCTVWERMHFTVTAQNQIEADKIAALCIGEALTFDPDANPGETVCSVFEDETLYDTIEVMSTEENHGDPTIEVFRKHDHMFIADNRKNQ